MSEWSLKVSNVAVDSLLTFQDWTIFWNLALISGVVLTQERSTCLHTDKKSKVACDEDGGEIKLPSSTLYMSVPSPYVPNFK